ncbi:hypothetical protein P106B_05 [Rhizobium phage vB_RglS_P106B]|uniref:Uncharacterized protein n=1 Tax=Rhizobium phage vB_RglS_P106B TaxID=1458697 RepID=W6E9M2_9CAUD|nr:hypothetical protein P106B_05 [Rhizobium phage vB_RglS_P106B]AHJ10688.1 hypothetical protein P106B_05 [Rhizobium phage vB_RglS_P106B]
MTWKSDERLKARNYYNEIERDAFRAGYSDGYHGYLREAGDWPDYAYNAGYWEGVADDPRRERK